MLLYICPLSIVSGRSSLVTRHSVQRSHPMRIPIDRRQSTPLYQQIETFLRQSIVAGTLAPTTRLPAARQVAHDLGVSRITVENAYAALEADGLVERRAGSGTYVQQPDLLPTRVGSSGQDWPLWQHDALSAAGLAQPDAPAE